MRRRGNRGYLQHLRGLLALVDVHDAGLPVAVRVPDQRGDLPHHLLLEDVGLGPDPRQDGLQEGRSDKEEPCDLRINKHAFPLVTYIGVIQCTGLPPPPHPFTH